MQGAQALRATAMGIPAHRSSRDATVLCMDQEMLLIPHL